MTTEAFVTTQEFLLPAGLEREVLVDAVDSALRRVGRRSLLRRDDAYECARIVTDASFGEIVPEVRELEGLVQRIRDEITPAAPIVDALLDLRLRLRSSG